MTTDKADSSSQQRNPAPAEPTRPAKRIGTTGLIFLGLFGVLLPAGTLIFELVQGFCAEALFDPIPSFWHVLLVATVPIANALALFQLRHQRPPAERWMTWLIAIAVGVNAR